MRYYPLQALLAIAVIAVGGTALAAEYTVNPAGGNFQTVQAAIDAVSDGDIITVAPGTYVENIYFDGKNIVLRSEDPEDPDVVDTTILDGGGVGSVVTFDGSEDASCELSGFTITNGESGYGAGIYGGVFGSVHSEAIISYCKITENTGAHGGGLYGCDGRITNCEISDNTASTYGGGLAYCDAVICDCVVTENTSAGQGGGLYDCDGSLYGLSLIHI